MRWKMATAFGLLLLAGVLYFALARPVQVLPLMGPVSAFELVDDRGLPYRSHERVGKITLYTFGTSRDRAGLERVRHLLGDLSQRLRQEPDLADNLEFAFITLDGEYDTPERLAALRPELGTTGDIPLHLLTGSWVALRLAVGTGLGVYYEPVPGDGAEEGTVIYEPTVLLVDGNGVMRARHDGNTVTTDILVRDLGLLQKEAAAQGAERWVYAGAHLFLCYPR